MSHNSGSKPPAWNPWADRPGALVYPLKGESLPVILVGALVVWLCSASLFGLPAVVIFLIGLVQFVLLHLRHSALGGSAVLRISAANFLHFSPVLFKLLLLVLAWSATAESISALSTQAGVVVAITGFLFLPAFTSLLVLEDSLLYALHPARLARFILRGGIPYLLLAAATGFLLNHAYNGIHAAMRTDGFAAQLVFGYRPPAMFGWLVAGLYFAMAFAHVLGRITGASHDFRPPEGHAIAAREKPPVDSSVIVAARLGKLLRSADRDATLTAWKMHADTDHAFQAALLDALKKERAWGLVPLQAQRTISMKLAANRQRDALELAMDIIRDYDSFATANASAWATLCRVAKEIGRGDWLEVLADKASGKFAGDPELLDIALLRAQYLALQADDVAGAIAVLTPYAEWRAHHRHERVTHLLESLREVLEK